jgi:hypothetical protein
MPTKRKTKTRNRGKAAHAKRSKRLSRKQPASPPNNPAAAACRLARELVGIRNRSGMAPMARDPEQIARRRIALWLVLDPELGFTTRDIAGAMGVSIGLPSQVRQDLIAHDRVGAKVQQHLFGLQQLFSHWMGDPGAKPDRFSAQAIRAAYLEAQIGGRQ